MTPCNDSLQCLPTTLYENRPSAGIGVVEVQKHVVVFFAIFNLHSRPSAGIGVVEVQKRKVFYDFCGASPLRGSAWSRSKNLFFAISAVLARPSAGIGVVAVQKLEFSYDFCGARAALCGDRRGRGAKLEVFCGFCCSNWSSGVVSWFARLLPGPAGCGFDSPHGANCIKQLAQSNLRRGSCSDQFAQSSLRRATFTDQFAQITLPRATCAEQLTQSNLHRETCTEQLAQSNLQGAICTEQLAGSHLQGATCRKKRTRPAALGQPRLRCYAFGPTVV